MKKLAKKVLEYTAVFEPAEKGGYVVSVPLLPGCMSQGDDFEDAKEMIKDAIKGYLSVLDGEKGKIPHESEEVVITKISIPAF